VFMIVRCFMYVSKNSSVVIMLSMLLKLLWTSPETDDHLHVYQLVFNK